MSEPGEGVNVDSSTVDTNNDSGVDVGLGAGIRVPEEDIKGLFSEDEIQAKRTTLEAAKAEEARRANLTDEERAAEDQAKAEEDAKSKVPDEYAAFTAPDGVTLDPELIDDFKVLAKEYGLTQEKAQKLVDFQIALDAKRKAQEMEMVKGWSESAAKDTEYGGAKIKESLIKANRALDKFATPELKSLLQTSGINNHPEFIRMWVRLAGQVMDDTMHVSSGRAGDHDGPRTFNYENTK